MASRVGVEVLEAPRFQPGWGFYPSGGLGLILLIIIILAVTGRL